MRWEPLLEGQLADQALTAARDIAVEIAESPGDATPTDRTLYWAYTSNVIDEPFAAAAYDAALDDLVAELQRGALHPSLYNNGLAGMGWTLGHVLDQDAADALEVIDEALVRVVSVDEWRGHHDLAQGLVGYGVYFLERLASGSAPIALRGLHETVRHLDALALRSDRGATWLTPKAMLPEHYHQAWPEGHFDCGLAHGVAGTIAFLARAAAVQDAPPLARPLCDEAVRWLSAQRQSPDPSGRFPGMTFTGAPEDRTRAAWCYGDPGVASALWFATDAGDVARETALDCARRTADTASILDSGLCHGACGLAHLLNRFYQSSGDAVHADAARGWYARTLEMRGEGGIAGFTAWRGNDDGYQPIANLLEGAMGVGLSLLAAATPNAPNWDRMMLVDLPVEGGV
jgi:lantibiotic modifying enzyme